MREEPITPSDAAHAAPAHATAAQPAAPKDKDFAFANDWPGFFRNVRGKPPRETLLTALEKFDDERIIGTAVDLAAGEGRDTLELLRRGWRVLAIEMVPEGINLLREQTPPEHLNRLETQLADFASARLPQGIDLINCSFSLPFCPPHHFDATWTRIAISLRPGGRFAGQLFGDRDSWTISGRTLGHTRAHVDRLLEGFVIEELREEEKDDSSGVGPKHWHVFHIVARKR